VAWATINMVAQAFQVGVASDPEGSAPEALLRTMSAVFTIANLPLAVMLVAVAVISLRYHAFAIWLAWLAFAAAGAQSVFWGSAEFDTGPPAAAGWAGFRPLPL